eukprot:1870817-Amphidinium_carterae.4
MPIDHLPKPVAMFAVYNGHRPTTPALAAEKADGEPLAEEPSPACAEFCARNLHKKLLAHSLAHLSEARLADIKGDWGDDQVASALRSSCEDVDAEFLSKGPGSRLDGCSVAPRWNRVFVCNASVMLCAKLHRAAPWGKCCGFTP